jgi:hypothetical protein
MVEVEENYKLGMNTTYSVLLIPFFCEERLQ